jgi:A/G-specific adenine glycosylase
MLQQTTVPAVIPHFEKWVSLFPDVGTLARSPLPRVLKAWEGLGYYQRARNLHRAARIIAREHSGMIPEEYGALISLPGSGPYTAAAVLSLAFGQPYPVLDANVRRVAIRLSCPKKGGARQTDAALLRYLGRFFPAARAAEFNQAMMELGALLCRPRAPLCSICPLRSFCRALERRQQDVIPQPTRSSPLEIETVVGLIERDGKYLIQKRPPTGLLAGLWEFPGGKRENGESLERALRREIKEELGVGIRNPRLLLRVRHAYTRFKVTLYAFACQLASPAKLVDGRRRWVSLNTLNRYPFPSGSLKIIRFLKERQALKNEGGRAVRA